MKNILISGGTRGIGKAIAALLSKSPKYKVFAPGSKEMDITNREAIDVYFKKNKIKKIDILVNNAGYLVSKEFTEHSDEELERTFNTNLMGAIYLSQKVLPTMVDNEYGRIINISSISGVTGEAYAAAYSASKAALIGLTKSLAYEYGSEGITVNAICPGWVRTDMAKSQFHTKAQEKEALGGAMQNRWIEPKEIAQMVNYLISDEAKGITGESINITAGL